MGGNRLEMAPAPVGLLGWLAAFLLIALCLATPGAAQSASEDPVLRIETFQHSSPIRDADVDAEEKLFVTASYDRTVRVWAITKEAGNPFRLERILRPPIGRGDEGKLYAVAVSPDGQYVAAGGWTGESFNPDGDYQLYIFDWRLGQIVKTISGLKDVVNTLAFSPDGSTLVAGLGFNKDALAFNTSDWSLKARLTGIGDNVYGMTFAADGRLAITSYDGFIRLYDQEMRAIARERAPDGNRPYGIDFSPDGSEIVIGYADRLAISVLDGQSLAPKRTISDDAVLYGSFLEVAWSQDGAHIYTGGQAETPRPYKEGNGIWKFDAQTGNLLGLLTPAQNTVMKIRTLKEGRLAYVAQDPIFGMIDGRFEGARVEPSPVLDFRTYQSFMAEGTALFRLAPDASAVSLPTRAFSREEFFTFDIKSRRLTVSETENKGLFGPRKSGEGFEFAGLRGTEAPTLNGQPIRLDQYENAREAAIFANGNGFVLGSDWYLRSFNKEIAAQWVLPVPSTVWRVNVSEDGRFAVAALGDGTIRWYRLSDGEEVLALYVSTDLNRARWVMWTPQGFFDASPGAEDLIGWHVNKGPDAQSLFYGASRFRERYYRPDVIDLVLQLGDVDLAVEEANKRTGRAVLTERLIDVAPPVVRIFKSGDSIEFGANTVSLRYVLESPSGKPVSGLRVQSDGQLLKVLDGDALRLGTVNEVEISDVPSRDVTLSLIAETPDAVGEPDSVALTYTGAAPLEDKKPKLYALIVGVSDYEMSRLKLNFAAQDAEDFAAALEAQEGGLYSEVNIRTLTDGEATRVGILDGLSWLEQSTTPEDVAVIFMAGHGVTSQNARYYFLPVEADPAKLRATGLTSYDIRDSVQSIAGRVFVFLDTCYAGAAMDGTLQVNITPLVSELASAETGAVVFSSSTGQQPSLEGEEWGNGAFTEAVLEGLSGGADLLKDEQGAVTVTELDLFVVERVRQLTNGEQQPVMAKPSVVPNFALALAGRG